MQTLLRLYRECKIPVAIFIVSRVIILFAVFIVSAYHVDRGVVLTEWDANNYIYISQHGYQFDGTLVGASGFIAYFPFLPLILFWFHFLTGIPEMYIGFILAFVFGVASVILLYKLVKEWANEYVAQVSVTLMSFYPMSFFLSAVYTESFFLFFTLLTFYLLSKNQYVKAIVPVAFACITRVTGSIVGVVYVWQIWKKTKSISKVLLCGALAFLPLGMFLLYQHLVYGTPFAFLYAQHDNWLSNRVWPWQGVWYHAMHMFNDPHSAIMWRVEFLFMVGTIITLILSFKKVPRNIWIFGLGVLLLTLTSDRILGVGRYMIMVLPIFYYWGEVLSRRAMILSMVIAFSASFMALNTVLYVLGKLIF